MFFVFFVFFVFLGKQFRRPLRDECVHDGMEGIRPGSSHGQIHHVGHPSRDEIGYEGME